VLLTRGWRIVQPVAQIPFLISEILATPTALAAVVRITTPIPLVTTIRLVTPVGFLAGGIIRALLLRGGDTRDIWYRDLDRRLLLTDSGGTGQHYCRGCDETDPHFFLHWDTPFLKNAKRRVSSPHLLEYWVWAYS
jgi:hypothetical protein